ncbi:MAG: family 2 glycosyl transferase [Acutalibacteraceae bacterium]
MKNFIITVCVIVVLYISADIAYYRLGFYIDLSPDEPVTTFVKTDSDSIYLDSGSGFEVFEIKGVNMGSGEPGEWSTDFDIDKQTYLRWFKQIQEMGANTLRIYTVQNDTFYNAFYEYNKDNENPLWLIHGVWVNDYIQNSHRDAYDKDFYDTFLESCKTLVDVLHGNKKITLGRMASAGSGTYKKDISQWVIGYILGVEWEDVTVVYTNEKYEKNDKYNSYNGKYMYTSEDATPFEAMLARVGDKVIEYESERYKQQRLVAFSNWPTTDPFDYPEKITSYFMKCAKVDVEHIKTTESFLSGQFASYHVYPYYPDYLNYADDLSVFGITDLSPFITEDGKFNSYKAYLSLITEHHTIPVVISEFGVSTGRAMAQKDFNTGRNQGNMSENEQGQALIDCYNDIKSTGCAGGCVFSWQDEWFKRTWNTMYAVNLKRTPYWSDYQTNEQYFGLLSFDPGTEKSVCYVDGDVSEWSKEDIVSVGGESSISVKYDEKFIYFLVYKKNLNFENETLYIPIDTTQKSGSSYCKNYNLLFDRAADFIIVLNGRENSRVQVQERYEVLRSTYSQNVYDFDTYVKDNIPDIDSPEFVNINMILKIGTPFIYLDQIVTEVFETGKLTYGNANPESADFNSLADFICNGDYIEIKLPWQLLNFSDPSRMNIHDDYYDGNYGIEYIAIDEMFVGLSCGEEGGRISLNSLPLKGWGNKVTYHERLKSSYYRLQSIWSDTK